MKILIAEDNAHIRNGLMEVLAHEGYRPIAAEMVCRHWRYTANNSRIYHS